MKGDRLAEAKRDIITLLEEATAVFLGPHIERLHEARGSVVRVVGSSNPQVNGKTGFLEEYEEVMGLG